MYTLSFSSGEIPSFPVTKRNSTNQREQTIAKEIESGTQCAGGTLKRNTHCQEHDRGHLWPGFVSCSTWLALAATRWNTLKREHPEEEQWAWARGEEHGKGNSEHVGRNTWGWARGEKHVRWRTWRGTREEEQWARGEEQWARGE